ncbi:MAG: proteasome subunit beta [Candidatus Korarchaeota archaeon]
MEEFNPYFYLKTGLGRANKLLDILPSNTQHEFPPLDEKNIHLLKTGTTTVGLVAQDGVVLATESKVTAGHVIMSTRGPKIVQVTPTIAVTIAGGVSDCQHLINLIKAHIKIRELEWRRPALTREVASILSNAMFNQRWYPYYSMLLLGGYDRKLPAYEGGPGLYMIDPLGSLIEEKVVATGSGSVFAYGVLESRYHENVKIDEAVEIAKSAIKAAAKRDIYSGGGMQLAKITDAGVELTVE